ncbi:MAG: Prevent-host-death family protein [Candidatus Beckwithbacteria bacterium GW2011_GWA2_43_10]|uniref:Antitoxin n=1 Tax=Candidatus Beckwithbacteria bacterium GW2011_GWA2_43_10 TaxID=1618369 RepID=A0A0G1C2J6_9BACT|nr:MAG: Prevent-host-death family protein [Candidatus Beckwithbacteria bacterium GW2011_GWA2_43_10]
MDGLSVNLPASVARKNFYTMLDEVNEKLKRFTISLRGKVKAVVIHPDEVESWRETIELMGDKKLMWELKQSQAQFKRGDYVTEEELLKKLGLNLKTT